MPWWFKATCMISHLTIFSVIFVVVCWLFLVGFFFCFLMIFFCSVFFFFNHNFIRLLQPMLNL